MENPTHSFREMNVVLQLKKGLQINNKNVMNWSLQKKKECIFCNVYLVQRKFFNICVISHCIVYWLNFQNIHTFTYQKTLLHTLLLLVCKIVKSLQCILNDIYYLLQYKNFVEIFSPIIETLLLQVMPLIYLSDEKNYIIKLGLIMTVTFWLAFNIFYNLRQKQKKLVTM